MIPQFSVLMSVYHKENAEFLELSLKSILNQTNMPEQIILVKDGELTNELDEVIDSFKKVYYDLFTIVYLLENKGLANALNEGIKVSRNSIIARMDSDDISIDSRFEIQLKCLIDNDLDIVGGQIIEFSKDIEHVVSVRSVPTSHSEIVKFLKFRSAFSHPTVVFRREVFDKLGGYDVSIFPEDYDFFVRAYLAGFRFGNVKDNVLYFRLGENLTEAIKRRWGWKYALNEIKLYNKFLKLGFFNSFDYLKAICFKIPLRLIPFKLYSYIYFKYSR